ncbi:PREDICTED: probable helicase senataxin isoform X3 [Condylura cristata]|uniref:probable helicase senataxin isoform X3 n=1 Tax=Condylura cristata TaxID=143302 RepID=UPI000642C3BF|nr:PREDICTED: probable helicase senataxin isoform X3 [Condylura cristata]
MSTCCWCTPGGVSTADLLKRYAARTCSREFQTADEDLCYCLECVAEYHKARESLPFLHEALWELETLRLINYFEKSMKGEIGDDDELYIVDNNGEAQLFDFTGQDFENKLRVPLLEILKYPYLLLHERVNELCVEALCRMEQANCSFQVFDKHPGIYLFLVHPNEMVRRWAILTARNLGKVDRDDYYDLQEVLTCLFKVIELGLLESPDIYTSSVLEKGKLILLPSHMYDTANYKNYWLGICMLLTILEEQAMDSLLLGSEKQNDFMQSILHTMERQADDDSVDPFWPALHCFMVILDRLGSKVWGQLIDPIEAFQTIINNASYNREIQNIRNSSARTKYEPESLLDDMVSCSQIVYNYNPEKTKKDLGWRSAICPDYCPNMYEEMETLASVLQSDIGQDMRVHNSTFLWFIPFVQSLMDLKDLGVAYIVEVIHHLHSEVRDVLGQADAMCDKVTEFFLLILVSVIELHRNKRCLHLLWVSSQQWVEAVVKCAKLPATAFARTSEKSAGSCSRGSAVASSLALHALPSNSVQLACVQLIRSLLKEGYQLGQQTLCKRFWDKLNLFLRGNLSLGWQLTSQETHELQTCLKQIIRNIKFKVPQYSTYVELAPACKNPPAAYKKEKNEQTGKKSKKHVHCLENSSPTFSKEPVKADAFHMQERVLVKATSAVADDGKQHYVKDSKLQDHLSAELSLKQASKSHHLEKAPGSVKMDARKQKSVKENPSYMPKRSISRNGPERGCGGGAVIPARSLANSSSDSVENGAAPSEDLALKDDALGKTSKTKKAQKDDICAKLSHVIKKQHRRSMSVGNFEATRTLSDIESFYAKRDAAGQKGDGFAHSVGLDPNGVLGGENGEQKSQSSLLLKKQFKKELGIFSSCENSDHVQDCSAGDKDLVSLTEMTSAFMKKTPPFEDPLAVFESREDSDPSAGQVSSALREQASSASPSSDTLTDSQVAQEWMSSPNKEKYYQLHVRKFPAEYKKSWEFVAYLKECELAKQLHPKENDLVFLVPEKLSGEKDAERNCLQDPYDYYCGYVHKFRRTSVMRNGRSECSLSIQTQDTLPVGLNELVRCTVISSLVTTQRKLKAMSLLSGRNQLARAVLNPNPMDFCTKDLLTTTSERIVAYLRDFNEDQKKAIETAYAMVKHSPAVAKICLIHGPPGTGKSKTIVGLLYRLLTETQRRGHLDENSNAKIKQNRVLVCAPSNAAVDELMKKIILEFKEKCKDKKNPLGNCGDINLVRLGPEKSINNEVLKFSLDSQVSHRMKKDLPSHVQEMHRRKDYLDLQLDELSRQRALCRVGREMQKQELDEKIARVSKERQELASKIKEVQGRPQKTQSIIILESHVICCTLSTSGGLLLESAFRGQGGVPFSCVIVDEAGQSCEVETLTPLIHRCNKLILVGDPKQLPPTVISMKAQEYGYDQSMMARFCKLLGENVEHDVISRLPIVQLTTQYRMHPDICLFPSNYVYNRSLKTNRVTETNRCSSDWPFQPYLVFDVGDGSERRDNDSYVNIQEIKLVMEIIKLIKEKRKDVTFRNIGIITHYKAQKTMIQKDLDKEFDRKGPAEVDTVDAFQGRQKDCVIVTCVRANTLQGSIGFLASLQRLNVTITRAKYSLFILGHLRTLMENQHWNHLIQDAQKRGAIIKTCDRNYKHDATKILKLKPTLQRSLTHPPAVAPEACRPPGGLPGSRPDTSPSASSLYHTPPDARESAVPAKDTGKSPAQDQLRDPRLLRRMGLAPEAHLRDPQPPSPQHPAATPPCGEPGFPGSPQDLGSAVPHSTIRGASLGSHQPQAQSEPLAAGPEAASSKRKCEQGGELSHRREARALSDGDQDTRRAASPPVAWGSGWDPRRAEDEGSSKKRKLL